MAGTREFEAALEAALRSGDLLNVQKLAVTYSSDDFVQEWPQSGERLTKEATIRLGEQYSDKTGTDPKYTHKRMLAGGDLFVIEGTIDYGDGIPVSYVGVGELRDGRITKMTEYFANPFEAPEWRSGFVERMEPTAT